ncbi:hypothetical protein THAOC_02211 [Thalassiosira oceanica]|uniref:Uncharacterized protein n=1 Tax=Thalassiosira oceanica TaxID=159749 RepID=K0TQH2_THAOC|nr:hypothetical protein THAOC_02211 [Thalassiosira oceanica]|eukprot:EJK76042.1 hypothetical protein THAOC_02211 [Thalassiosira oceanica]
MEQNDKTMSLGMVSSVQGVLSGTAALAPQEEKEEEEEEQSASETQMWDFIEFCELSRPKPRHVDAPVWESLLNWLCFESPCSDDFPANGRVNADPIVKTNDELASRLKEFIEEEEDHDVNVTRLLSRAAEHKAGGPEQKRNSHQHNKSRFRSVLRPFQRVLHASGRTTLTCERYHGGTIYAVGCSDYIWTVDEDGEIVYSSSQLAETSPEIAERDQGAELSVESEGSIDACNDAAEEQKSSAELETLFEHQNRSRAELETLFEQQKIGGDGEQESSVELETLFEHGVRRNDTLTINDRAQRMDHEAIDSVMPSQPRFALWDSNDELARQAEGRSRKEGRQCDACGGAVPGADFINNNMRLTSEMTIGGVIGAKSANEGDSVQPRERGDFELKPVEGDGSIQSIASDGICTNPVGDGDGD